MGKRSNFKRRERDFYPTPYEAVVPLLPHLTPGTQFDEPCAGDGSLRDILVGAGHTCTAATDIDPQRDDIGVMDALDPSDACFGDCYITNPPWERGFLHELIIHLSDLAPTWLLFDADWMHTKQSAPYMARCMKIVSVGRVKWIPDSKMTGKDNCAWYFFIKDALRTDFYGRTA